MLGGTPLLAPSSSPWKQPKFVRPPSGGVAQTLVVSKERRKGHALRGAELCHSVFLTLEFCELCTRLVQHTATWMFKPFTVAILAQGTTHGPMRSRRPFLVCGVSILSAICMYLHVCLCVLVYTHTYTQTCITRIDQTTMGYDEIREL